MQETSWTPLLGVAFLIIGLALRLRPTIVVAAGAFATGLLGGMPIFTSGGKEGIVDMLGRAFADNRIMTLFLITLPAIGLAERFGLQEQSAALIRRLRAATFMRIAAAYQLFRVLHGALGIRLNGHPVFVRPLLYPMARAASIRRDDEELKAACAASENYGNFYGQNLSPVQPGILLVYTTLKALGYEVSVWRLVLFTTPIVILSVVLAIFQFRGLERKAR